jgi:hypothetical protein
MPDVVTTPCGYCGTPLLKDGWTEYRPEAEAKGTSKSQERIFHFSSRCSRNLYEALKASKAEVTRLEAALDAVNLESASDKALIRRITEICPYCPAEEHCDRCEGAGVIPVDTVTDEELERVSAELDRALDIINVLHGGVHWYADPENYSLTSGAPYNHGLDEGRVARQALELARLVAHGVPLDTCNVCGAARETWQPADGKQCPRHADSHHPCHGVLVPTTEDSEASL